MKSYLILSSLVTLLLVCGTNLEGKNALPAQTKPEPLPQFLKKFVLPEHNVLKFKKGDLNKDKLDDYIIVLENQKNDGMAARPLLLIVQTAKGTYKLAAQNDNVVSCKDCGGKMDPLHGIAIKNGFFTIEHEGGSREMWTRYITFRYDAAQKSWALHRIDESVVDTLEPSGKNNSKKTRTTKEFGTVLFTAFKEGNF